MVDFPFNTVTMGWPFSVGTRSTLTTASIPEADSITPTWWVDFTENLNYYELVPTADGQYPSWFATFTAPSYYHTVQPIADDKEPSWYVSFDSPYYYYNG